MAEVSGVLPDFDLPAIDESPATQTPSGNGAPAPASRVGETSFEDESVQQFDFDVFKGRKNIADRLAVLNPKQLKWARTHYIKGKGYFLCNSTYGVKAGKEVIEKTGLCCKKLDEAKKRFGALVIQYGTDPKGVLLKPLTFRPMIWRFSESLFVSLRDINREFPLDAHDLIVRCTDETFQKMTLTACKESIIRMKAQGPAGEILAKAYVDVMEWSKSMAPKAEKAIGKLLTDAEYLERLGLATQSARTVDETVIPGDLDALLES